jgi:hypothetical protein
MAVNEKIETLTNANPYKVVGLIGSIVAILAIFVGAVTWVSLNMAKNSISISTLKEGQIRHEVLIQENAEIIRQHAYLISVIDQHGSSIKILTNFMTQGGRFTEADGRRLHLELQVVKDQLQHYEVLEAELSWIKKSIQRIENDLIKRFESLDKKLDK